MDPFCSSSQRRLTRSATRRANAASTHILDLDADTVHRIFCLLGGSPRDIAPVAAVCGQWRSIAENMYWKEKCLQAAAGLCKVLEYSEEKKPPGGWLGLFKFLVYCPGLYPTLSDVVKFKQVKSNGHSWCEYLGHVENEVEGFSLVTGENVCQALNIREEFCVERFLVSTACFHTLRAVPRDRQLATRPDPSLDFYGARGIIVDFLRSKVAHTLRVRDDTISGRRRRGPKPLENVVCPYCQGPLFDLKEKLFQAKASLEGSVCVKGHLLLGMRGGSYKVETKFRSGSEVEHSRQGIELHRSGASKFLCRCDARFEQVSNLQDGVRLLESVDLSELIKVARRLTGVVELCNYDSGWSLSGWKPPEHLVIEALLRKSNAGGGSLFKAICTGEGDCKEETVKILKRNERWAELSRQHVRQSSLRRAPMSAAIEKYLRGGAMSVEKILQLQQKHPEKLNRWGYD